MKLYPGIHLVTTENLVAIVLIILESFHDTQTDKTVI